MTIEHVLNWLPLECYLVMMAERWVRVVAYYRRGHRVIIADRRRSKWQQLYDLVVLSLFLFWLYVTIAEALRWPVEWLPAPLMTRIVSSRAVRLAGAALMIAGTFLYELALQHMGDSWRIGIDRNKPGPLVTNGLFNWLRNPMYLAFDLMFVGTFFLFARVIYLMLAIVLVLLIHGIILREERFLTEKFGDAFRDYRQRVRRYGVF
jgi:protein-S-isoprenylcysteine O-methyltransferase Ste14